MYMCKTTTAIKSLSADAHCVISFDSEIALIKTGTETYHRKLPKVPIPSPLTFVRHPHMTFNKQLKRIITIVFQGWMVGGGQSLECGKSKDLLRVQFDFSIQIITKVVHISENDKGHHSQPFNSQIKFVILSTVNHTILLMLVLRI